MTLSVKQGVYTKSTTTTGLPFTDSVTGLGFQPKVLFMWTAGTTADGTYGSTYYFVFGFSDGTNSMCRGGGEDDAAATSVTYGTYSAREAIISVQNNADVIIYKIKVTSFDSDGFTLTYSTANNASAVKIAWLAVGGTDITNVKCDNFLNGRTTTGNQAYTGVGFKPDFLMILNPGDISSVTPPATNTGPPYASCIGAGTSSSRRWLNLINSEDGRTTMDARRKQATAKITQIMNQQTGADMGTADLVSLDTDGFTLNWSTAADFNDYSMGYLAIKGGLWEVGDFSQKTSTGSQTTALSNTGLTPKGLMLFSFNNVASEFTNVDSARNTIGASDGTNECYTWMGSTDNVADSVCACMLSSNKIIRHATENATHTSSTTQAEADFESFTSGNFAINWSTADAIARQILYIVVGSTAAGTNFDRPLPAETISISEISLTRLYGSNRAPTAETIAISESQARMFAGVRAISAETNTIGESQTRLYGANRAHSTETITIGESLARLLGANRVLSTETIAVSESLSRLQGLVRTLTAETTAITESLTRVYGVVRTLSDTIATTSESLVRVYNAIRSLSDTTVISESLAKGQVLIRSLSDTSAISESLARILGISRSLSDITTIGESLARVLGAIRALVTQTTTIGESSTRVFGAVRSLTDSTAISESLVRLLVLVRALSDTIIESGTVATVYTSGAVGTFVRSLSDTTVISESLARSITNARSLIETTVIGESLSRILGAIRSVTDTTIISESLTRLSALTRLLSDTITIGESLTKIYGAVRNLSDTTIISESLSRLLGLTRTLTDTTTAIISETLSRIQGLTRTLTDTTIAITGTVTRTYGILKSLSDTISVSESIVRSVVLVRSLIESVTILESLVRTIIGIIVDYVPSLETDFTNYIDEMIISYIFDKWSVTGQLLKGNDMIDVNSRVEFKIGIHSSRPYQVLALEQQTEIDKLSINKFSGGISRFFTTVEITVMVQRLQRDIPIELSQMEKEIQRIVCHYRRNEIVGIDDLILVGMRREFTGGNNNDWSKSIWSTKIYFKTEYQKVNTEIMNINGY